MFTQSFVRLHGLQPRASVHIFVPVLWLCCVGHAPVNGALIVEVVNLTCSALVGLSVSCTCNSERVEILSNMPTFATGFHRSTLDANFRKHSHFWSIL
jgi:hypothetical protein